MHEIAGILPVNKPCGKTSFSLVRSLRRLLGVQKIGHAGTLDPFASGVMIMLVGRSYTRLSDTFLHADKEYLARIQLGVTTDTFDCDGEVTSRSESVPSGEAIETVVSRYQGEIEQIPPMFSAKKMQGKKLYELARQGKTVERQPVKIKVTIRLLGYQYPHVDIGVTCSKGTYVRSLADDIGRELGCGGHLVSLERIRSGTFHLDDCIDGSLLFEKDVDLALVCSKLGR